MVGNLMEPNKNQPIQPAPATNQVASAVVTPPAVGNNNPTPTPEQALNQKTLILLKHLIVIRSKR
jgi:hypothetical protein